MADHGDRFTWVATGDLLEGGRDAGDDVMLR
jgi:hypothetical protein